MRLLTSLILGALALPALATDKVADNVEAALSRGGKAAVLVSLGEQARVGKIAEKHSGDDRLIASVAGAARDRGADAGAPARVAGCA
ncbi:MAG: hypothetical protein IPO66_03500, partial [Rhodanobacteraceae bacterium]|nr:hypothetical protein [Rhodanobacteraceae bacterium]